MSDPRYIEAGPAPYYSEGGFVIYHGDCRDVLPTLDRVDHVITDPPYARDVYVRLTSPNTNTGSGTPARVVERPNTGQSRTSPRLSRLSIPAKGKEGRVIHDIKNGSLAMMAAGDIGCIDEMLEAVALEIARLTKRWALVFSDAETLHRWKAQLEIAGMRYVRTGAWVKPDAMPQMSGDRPSVGFEPCTICHAQGAMRWNGGGSAAVWTYNTAKKNRPNHPCPKPEPLMRDLVNLFSDEGETILDPFMGSGTTLVAAKRYGRKGIGIEVNEAYCEIAATRLSQGAFNFSGEQLEIIA
jgi:DNA modification methylase